MIGKVLAVALAVGFDTFAVSIGIGVARPGAGANRRLGMAFAAAEITMQLIGYVLGTRAGGLVGAAAAYAGFALLAVIGAAMLRGSFQPTAGIRFDPGSRSGLFLTAMSISLDSFGVGIALPAAAIPLIPLLITVSITTSLFTFLGMAFGALLGERVERGAEGLAGAILIILAAAFTFERLF
jgi:putative Mn2+ efflux pump MntP